MGTAPGVSGCSLCMRTILGVVRGERTGQSPTFSGWLAEARGLSAACAHHRFGGCDVAVFRRSYLARDFCFVSGDRIEGHDSHESGRPPAALSQPLQLWHYRDSAPVPVGGHLPSLSFHGKPDWDGLLDITCFYLCFGNVDQPALYRTAALGPRLVGWFFSASDHSPSAAGHCLRRRSEP